MDAIDGADFNTGLVLDINARAGNNVGHLAPLPGQAAGRQSRFGAVGIVLPPHA
jgi:hypothetical protein